MSRLRAVLGSAAFLLFGGPTIVAGLVPWLLTGWDAGDPSTPGLVIGLVLIACGGALVLETTARFALEGRGTPVPFAAPARFVASGSYRWVRNPMYIGVLALIVGQALVLDRSVLLVWAAIAALLFHLFVVLHEEPSLSRRFGSDYEEYARQVGRWFPTTSLARLRRHPDRQAPRLR